MHRVQDHLALKGFPCPRPLLGPEPFGIGFATVDEFIGVGEHRNAHEPEVRRAMASKLAWQIQLASGFTDLESLSRGDELPDYALWPRPHNALFDFEATTEGAEWIDAFARRARSARSQTAGRIVVGHRDWSVKHFRFTGEKVRVVYDWELFES